MAHHPFITFCYHKIETFILSRQQQKEKKKRAHTRQQNWAKRQFQSQKIHRTLKGELVRSKSEVIIANMLFMANIKYDYEKPLILNNKKISPDFTLYINNTTLYWEHLGLLDDTLYNIDWHLKQTRYKYNHITQQNNRLIITTEPNGALDSIKIQSTIQRILNTNPPQ